MSRHVLVVRLDSLGDVVICGPATRAVAAAADRVTMLVGPRGVDAARLLPGVDDVVVWNCPWIVSPPPRVDPGEINALVARLRELAVDEALVLTSFHQSALPTALVLRMAGIGAIAAVSNDYPGDLLSARLADPGDAPEPERMLAVAAAAGYPLPAADSGLLALRADLRPSTVPAGPYVVVHAGTGASARAVPAERWTSVVSGLVGAGHRVVLTGDAAEAPLTAAIASAVQADTGAGVGAAGAHGDGTQVIDLAGRLTLAELAGLLRDASVCVAANTGPAHVAAAVGTPVVSLFAPVVPAQRWAPYGVPVVLLGDQSAACAGTRATRCPVPGHPCLSGIAVSDVVAAVETLSRAAGPRPAVAEHPLHAAEAVLT